MRRYHHSWPLNVVLILTLSFTAAVAFAQEGASADTVHNWPAWRGPLGTGASRDADPPVEWNEEKNVRWKTPLPGLGHSSPVVWGDRVYLTTAVPISPALPPRASKAP